MKNTFDWIAFARSSALEASDQSDTYGGLDAARNAYAQNVADTCADNGCAPSELEGAHTAFWIECKRIDRERNRRFFIIGYRDGKRGNVWPIACDGEALGRIIAQELGESVPGGRRLLVEETTRERYEDFQRKPGTVRL